MREYERVVTAEFSIGRFAFAVDDVIEFYGVSQADPSTVLFTTASGVGLLAPVAIIKSHTRGRGGPWPAAYHYPKESAK